MTVKCHVCGVREPINPSVRYPICGACKRSVWQREQYPPDVRAIHLREKLDHLNDDVIDVRRQKAACSGIASLPVTHVPD